MNLKKYRSKKVVAAVSLLFCLSFILPPKKKIKVWMIGDSTMCTYEPSRAPLTGWGMPFAIFFDSSVTIDNRARGGRSTRTFISENRWQPVSDSMQQGDYVLIQFGHNDEAKEEKYKDRYTSPEDYRKNLIRFITEAKVKQANPVLITPVSRRYFDKDGNIKETHKDYSPIVREVAKEQQVPMIDLDEMSRKLLEQLGAENSKLLFNYSLPGEHPNYPGGIKDDTHFNEFGARRMAQLVLAEMKAQHLELTERIVVPKVK
ncbi:MAG: rhamnogalacturonan acetylesterase [Pedobacter sp.]|nr:rhamnogalacturonan acetylesterase [Chitinophagaceae bacterium]